LASPATRYPLPAMHGAAAHAAIVNAIKASGVVVRVDAGDFLAILRRGDEPLVVVSYGGVFKKQYKYLTSYKGLAFFTKSTTPLVLPPRAEAVLAKAISVPDV
jgi:hypothetical protein